MLLDTNIVSAFLKRDAQKRTPELFDFVAAQLATQGLAISFVTQFELRRGFEELVRRGEGKRKLVAFEKLIERAQVLGLDGAFGEGWNLAARLWAEGRSLKPARVFTDADLLIAATAALYGHELATSEVGLADGLRLDVRAQRADAPRAGLDDGGVVRCVRHDSHRELLASGPFGRNRRTIFGVTANSQAVFER